MLLGGGYHGQRLNKIYRGLFLVYLLCTYLFLTNHPLDRISKRTGDSCYPQTNDQAVRFRETTGGEVR